MRNLLTKKTRGLSWKLKISLILSFTVLFSGIFHFGPSEAFAAITQVTDATDPTSFSVSPGAINQYLNAYTTSKSGSGSAPNTASVTVTFTGTISNISAVYLKDATGATTYGTVNSPSSLTVTFSGLNLGLGTYRIYVDVSSSASAGTITAKVTAGQDVTPTAFSPVSDVNGTTMTILAGDTTPPTVTSTTPANGATGVTVNSSLQVVFSENINCTTAAAGNITMSGATIGAPSCSAPTTTITYPISGQAAGTLYTYSISGVQDVAGNTMTTVTGRTYITAAAAEAANTVSASGTALASAASDTQSNVLMQRLTLNSDMVSGSNNQVLLSTLTLDDAGTSTLIRTVKVYISTINSATLPAYAVLLGGKSNWDGTSAVLSLIGGKTLDRTVFAGTPKYLYIVYDMAPGQATKTVQTHVSNVGVTSPDTSATVNLSSTSFTLSAGTTEAVVTSCTSCHAYPPLDASGTARNTPATAVVGSHGKHGSTCSSCHVTPATQTAADFGHRNGNIEFIGGVGYTKGASFAQTNPTDGTGLGTCSTATCHDAYGTTGIATPKWGVAATCASCHAAGADGSPGTGSHGTHMALVGAACNQCHAGATKDVSGGTAHIDNNVDVTGGYPLNVAKHTSGTGYSSCSSASCHNDPYSSGFATTPTWGSTGNGCSSCHGAYPINTTGPATGNHIIHMTNTVHGTIACIDCHNAGTTATTVPTTGHNDGSINATNGYPVTARHTAGTYTGTCTTTYCHSNGQSDNAKAAKLRTVQWGVTLNCGSCHNNMATFANATSGSHVLHAQTAKYTCQVCHGTSYSRTDANATTHVNRKIDLAFTNISNSVASGTVYSKYSAAGFAPAKGSYGSCSKSACHGGAAVKIAWGADTTRPECMKCHGSNAASFTNVTAASIAPGYNSEGHDLAGNTTPTAARVGTHQGHLTAATGISDTIHCGECHVSVATVRDSNHLNYTTATITFNGRAITQSHTPSVSRASGVVSCTNTYCHTGKTNTGSAMVPDFNNTTYLNSTMDMASCKKCHNMPPNPGVAGDHSTIASALTSFPVNNTCSCHSNLSTTGTTYATIFTDKIKHINGTVDVDGGHTLPYYAGYTLNEGHQGCLTGIGCHQNVNPSATYPAASGAPDCRSCHKKADPTASANCGSCHGTGTGDLAAPSGTTHPDQAAAHPKHMALSMLAGNCIYCHNIGGAGGMADHGPGNHGNTTTNPAVVNVNQGWGGTTCTASYCHSTVQVATGGAGAPTYKTTTAWAGGAAMTCTSCHGNDASTLTTGSHATHLSTTTHGTISCANCHSGFETGTGTAHANQVINVQQSAILGSTGTYTDSAGAPGNGFGSCGTSYCHSNVQSATGGARVAGDYKTVTWGSGTLNCASCHGNTAATLVTGTHAKHLNATYGYTCAACHGTAGGAGNTSIHANQTINIDLTTKGATATYTGDGTPANSNFGTCIATICHGRNSGTWGTSVSTQLCTECHGQANTAYPNFSSSIIAPGGAGVDTGGNTADTSPRVGTHQTHLLASTGISDKVHCGSCHTVHTAINEATHLNYTTSTITFGGIAKANSATPSVSRSAGVVSCSNTYCHGAKMPGGDTTGTNKAPAFNATTYLPATLSTSSCSVCHGFPPSTASGHPSVTAPSSFPTSNCNCHANISVSGNSYSNIFVDKNLHINGIYEPASLGNCVGCHAAQVGSAPTKRAAIVGGAAGSEGDDFIRKSRHVSNGTTSSIVTNFDCIVCHAEGGTNSTSTNYTDNSTYHGASGGSKTVDLRDVDSTNGATVKVAWPGTRLTATNGSFTATTTQRDAMDSFCMGCHDSNGSSQIAVNGTNTGLVLGTTAVSALARGTTTANFRPFNTNDTLANANDTLSTLRATFNKVLNVKDQFNSGNQPGTGWASHHNLNQFQKRYSSRNSTAWGNTAWVNTTTKEGVNLQTAGETAGLHCSDCHLNEVNAHGSRSSWYMLQDKTGADAAWTNSMTGTMNCFKCHSNTDYGSTGTGSRFTHSGGDINNFGDPTQNNMNIACLNCHGGYTESTSTGFGAIHGNNDTYTTAGGTTKRYRFMSGAAGRYFYPTASLGGAPNWETSTDYGCYTVTAADNWGSCTKHAGGALGSSKNATRRTRALVY